MLGRIVLIALQLAIGWFAAPEVLRFVKFGGGDTRIFVYAVAAAVIVWVVGLVAAQVLKDVGTPTPTTLVWALVGGLIGAALVVFKVPAMLPVNIPPLLWPLGLATLGYALKR